MSVALSRAIIRSYSLRAIPCSILGRLNYQAKRSLSSQSKRSLSDYIQSIKKESPFGVEAPGGSLAEAEETFHIPRRVREKIVSPQDAVSLIRSGDTITVSGFVCQNVPEAVLRALGERYEQTGEPNNLTLLFGGGPGDWKNKGLNHLAKKSKTSFKENLLKRTIGSHYGQVPEIAEMALSNEIEAWTLPLGSISRQIRSQSTHSPGHITTVGIGTYVDPDNSGGCANEAAQASAYQPISKVVLEGEENLVYKSMPIDVAILRGTTADTQGNITVEQESLLNDQRITAAAARNSGGVVIVQVKRLAENGSLKPKDVCIPGPLVDCVVVVDEEDHDELHPMSFMDRYDPSVTGEIRTPSNELEKIPLDTRKIIARRAFFNLKPNQVFNLGIGMPEGVAQVAAEEGMLEYITLTTEPGVFGGRPCNGHRFGPSVNPTALIEMNQMFDFYDGGGLDACFLGAAQIAPNGDVNVSRMSKDRLTGPGGFIDITQSTKTIAFLSTMTAKGLNISTTKAGELNIDSEGAVKKFVPDVFEVTFSGDEAVRRGQKVIYVTERAVFRRSAKHDVLELIEIAPGVDLQKDVLDQMEFAPVVSPDLKLMDNRIFQDKKMDMDLFGSLEERCSYHEQDHVLYLDMFGIALNTEEDVDWLFSSLRQLLHPLCEAKGPIDMVVNYDGFDLHKGLEDVYVKHTTAIEKDYYKSVKRFVGEAFHRAQLGKQIRVSEWDPDELYKEFDTSNTGEVSLEELREGFQKKFRILLTPTQLAQFGEHGDAVVGKTSFKKAIKKFLDTNN